MFSEDQRLTFETLISPVAFHFGAKCAMEICWGKFKSYYLKINKIQLLVTHMKRRASLAYLDNSFQVHWHLSLQFPISVSAERNQDLDLQKQIDRC